MEIGVHHFGNLAFVPDEGAVRNCAAFVILSIRISSLCHAFIDERVASSAVCSGSAIQENSSERHSESSDAVLPGT